MKLHDEILKLMAISIVFALLLIYAVEVF